MSHQIVLATKNYDKVKEIEKLLAGLNVQIVTLKDFPQAPDVIEDGATLADNAIKKAKLIAKYTGITAVADDTGLEVDYLNGRPGVFSSRYAGENATYADNVRKLLTDLQGVPRQQRGARFRCLVALHNGKDTKTVEGACNGMITEQPSGSGGFGYDPIFYVPEYRCTFSEMGLDLKNKISHRAQAFLAVRELIEKGAFELTYYGNGA